MALIVALIPILIVGLLASSGTAAYFEYAMVQEINQKRVGKGEKLRKWSLRRKSISEIADIVSDYRATCPDGVLLWPFTIAIVFFVLTASGLFAAFFLSSRNSQ